MAKPNKKPSATYRDGTPMPTRLRGKERTLSRLHRLPTAVAIRLLNRMDGGRNVNVFKG